MSTAAAHPVKRRIVRRKIAAVRLAPTPALPPLTAAEALAAFLNDPTRPRLSGAELAAQFPYREVSPTEQRVRENIRAARAADKRRALAEGFAPD